MSTKVKEVDMEKVFSCGQTTINRNLIDNLEYEGANLSDEDMAALARRVEKNFRKRLNLPPLPSKYKIVVPSRDKEAIISTMNVVYNANGIDVPEQKEMVEDFILLLNTFRKKKVKDGIPFVEGYNLNTKKIFNAWCSEIISLLVEDGYKSEQDNEAEERPVVEDDDDE